MLNFFGRLWSAVVLPIVVAASAPTGALAYNQWQMEHDQAAVNELTQEGVLSAPQAVYLNQAMSNRRAQSWMDGQGLSNNSTPTQYGMMPTPSTSYTRAENRQIDKLQRDHFITWQEANSLKGQVNAQASAMLVPQTSGMFMPQASVSGQLLNNAPVMTDGTIMGNVPMGSMSPMVSSSPMMNMGSPLSTPIGAVLPAGYYGYPNASYPNGSYPNAMPGSMPFVNSPSMLQKLRGILMNGQSNGQY